MRFQILSVLGKEHPATNCVNPEHGKIVLGSGENTYEFRAAVNDPRQPKPENMRQSCGRAALACAHIRAYRHCQLVVRGGNQARKDMIVVPVELKIRVAERRIIWTLITDNDDFHFVGQLRAPTCPVPALQRGLSGIRKYGPKSFGRREQLTRSSGQRKCHRDPQQPACISNVVKPRSRFAAPNLGSRSYLET